jgi:hypothetical protein
MQELFTGRPRLDLPSVTGLLFGVLQEIEDLSLVVVSPSDLKTWLPVVRLSPYGAPSLLVRPCRWRVADRS